MEVVRAARRALRTAQLYAAGEGDHGHAGQYSWGVYGVAGSFSLDDVMLPPSWVSWGAGAGGSGRLCALGPHYLGLDDA